MSRITLVTVSDDRSGRKGGQYRATQRKINNIFNLNKNKRSFILDAQAHVTFKDIQNSPFYQEYYGMLSQHDPARNGRLYKPYVIRQALQFLEEGDYLIYNDCSPEMWPMDAMYEIDPEIYSLDVIKTITSVNNDFLTAFVRWDDKFIGPGELGRHVHHWFTSDSCIAAMGGEQYRFSYQCASGMICIRKTPKTVALVDNWYHYNRMPECACMNVDETEDSYFSGKPGYKLGNRHDQSILSMLLNQGNYDYVDIVYNELNPYNFLNFCRKDVVYKFINSNTPLSI